MHLLPKLALAAVLTSVEETLWYVDLLLDQIVDAFAAWCNKRLAHILHAACSIVKVSIRVLAAASNFHLLCILLF